MVLLSTAPPSIFTIDTPELTAASIELGIAHAPGYPIYMLVGHIVSQIPFSSDIAYRFNILSALSLSLCIPIIFRLLTKLGHEAWLSASLSLSFAFTYYVWTVSIVAEVYALQLLGICLALWSVYRFYIVPSWQRTIQMSLLVGLAIAIHPSSALLGVGVAVVMWQRAQNVQMIIIAGILSTIVFLLSLLYFPLRYGDELRVNTAGEYDANGVFQPIDLDSVHGIWWMVSGQQFDTLFFQDGFIPSTQHLIETLTWFWGNFLGIGFLLGIAGIYRLWRTQHKYLALWTVTFLPYTYFYLNYDAQDRETMFAPAYLLWIVPLAEGARWFFGTDRTKFYYLIICAFPLLLIFINYPLIDNHDNHELLQRSQAEIQRLPENAHVFGFWGDVAALEYLQVVENQRPDLHFYKLFLFDYDTTRINLAAQTFLANGEPVIFLNNTFFDYLQIDSYTVEPFDITVTDDNTLEQDILILDFDPPK